MICDLCGDEWETSDLEDMCDECLFALELDQDDQDQDGE